MNHYCDMWFWRASDQAEVARHLRDRTRMTSERDTPQRAGLVRSALLTMLRMAGLVEQPLEARPVELEETPVRSTDSVGDTRKGLLARGGALIAKLFARHRSSPDSPEERSR